ncbi:surface-adhesin E family protein [Gemmatimonas sp.]|uniref:surface-adhesin E family protein n=1 Tax=Gemmatimonas sp. TaxID=1962908 RepID=UPI002ED93307
MACATNGVRNALAATVVALLALPVYGSVAGAQTGALKEIGKTSVGTPVFLEQKSVTRAGDVVTATVRVKLQPPIKNGAQELRSSRTIGMYDCAKQTVATKESWYYADDAGRKEGMHRTVKVPGFGPAIKGSLADVALKHLCTKP